MISVTYLILRFAIVQNKFQQTNKNKINHIIGNHIKFEVSLQFLGIWLTVRRRRRQSHTGSRLLLPACLAGAAQATALALHTGGKQHEIVQDWRIPAKKGRSSTPLSTSPTSVSTQRLRLHTTYDSL